MRVDAECATRHSAGSLTKRSTRPGEPPRGDECHPVKIYPFHEIPSRGGRSIQVHIPPFCSSGVPRSSEISDICRGIMHDDDNDDDEDDFRDRMDIL